jgi:hypothetical protein
MSSSPALPADLVRPIEALLADLVGIFGPRLRSLVAYGPGLTPERVPPPPRASRLPLNTLALVDALTCDDLQACAGRAGSWRGGRLAMPLLLGREDFARSLDVFPFEYGDIIARHLVLSGPDPFAGIAVRPEDLRRACEAQAKSHLIHLREGYLETGGHPPQVANLLLASASPLAVLLGHVARLRGEDGSTLDAVATAVGALDGVSSQVVRDVLRLVHDPVIANDEAIRLFPAYLDSVVGLVGCLDSWKHTG